MLILRTDNTGVTWGADYYDFPESGWDKLMALNVKSIFYMTVGLEPLLLNGATPDTPSRVINIASVAGLMTGDVTAGDEGGLSPPGTGTFSCTSNLHLPSLHLVFGHVLILFACRRPLQSSLHSSQQNDRVEARAKEYHGECHLSRRVSFAHDELRHAEAYGDAGGGAADGAHWQAE